MKKMMTILIAGACSLAAFNANAAAAEHREDRSSLRISVSIGDDHYDRRGHYDRRRGDNRRGYNDRRRVVKRKTYDTRFRANIVLTEEIVRGRRGPQLICTVQARGAQARYVPDQRLHRIARRDCSRRAQVRVYA